MKNVKNKLVGTLILVCGGVSLLASKDATFLFFTLLISTPLLFCRKNYIL